MHKYSASLGILNEIVDPKLHNTEENFSLKGNVYVIRLEAILKIKLIFQ